MMVILQVQISLYKLQTLRDLTHGFGKLVKMKVKPGMLALGKSTDIETYTPTEAGDYRLRGIVSCLDNFNQYSGIIPVSICPSDSDNDGIIDNIDLDLDNDGIYKLCRIIW